jgi:hypothetical protein
MGGTDSTRKDFGAARNGYKSVLRSRAPQGTIRRRWHRSDEEAELPSAWTAFNSLRNARRFPTKLLAPPSPAVASSKSPVREILRANHTSALRCADSTKCLPARCGRPSGAFHPSDVSAVSGERAGSSSTGRWATADRIATSIFPRRCCLCLSRISGEPTSVKSQPCTRF